MPLSENELLERDANRNIAEELLLSVKEFVAGQGTPVQISSVAIARVRETSGIFPRSLTGAAGVTIGDLGP